MEEDMNRRSLLAALTLAALGIFSTASLASGQVLEEQTFEYTEGNATCHGVWKSTTKWPGSDTESRGPGAYEEGEGGGIERVHCNTNNKLPLETTPVVNGAPLTAGGAITLPPGQWWDSTFFNNGNDKVLGSDFGQCILTYEPNFSGKVSASGKAYHYVAKFPYQESKIC